MDVLKVKTPLVFVHLKLFKVGILKQDHEELFICLRDPNGCFNVQKDIQMLISNGVLQVSGKKKNDEVSVIVPIFNKPEAFEIFYPPKKAYEATTIVNGVEKSLVNNRVVTNNVDASGLTRSGGVFNPANLRSGKPAVKNPDNCKAPLVIPESRPIQDVEAEEFLLLI
ncbi:hypothetical protein KIW84_034999 [Lathyrus oleraceus]|uniref:Uncharacterized protein n=1 Tax=Pisum sativum TaxID=3888 RepID=A0A9D4Y4W5_PEA|nr:hypothetical protein KIW84_034999 [Pisum sativum]